MINTDDTDDAFVASLPAECHALGSYIADRSNDDQWPGAERLMLAAFRALAVALRDEDALDMPSDSPSDLQNQCESGREMLDGDFAP